MAYDRYDRDDWRDERFGRDRHRPSAARRDREERGFFERAGDEIASWFGDDGDPGRGRGDRQDERGRRGYFGRDDDRRPQSSRWDRDRGDRFDRDDYRPVTGDYGRSGSEYGRSDEWGRDDYRRTSFAESPQRGESDPHYAQWRRRRMEELDRDYDEYRRETQSRFEEDFSGWRERRQSKRQMLSSIREHMEVVGKDGEHVGIVDRVAGDRIILTKSDPDADGAHHSISCTMLDRIEDDKVILDTDSKTAKQRWRDESRDRALFEREDQGEAGPHMLNRSFSGTYR